MYRRNFCVAPFLAINWGICLRGLILMNGFDQYNFSGNRNFVNNASYIDFQNGNLCWFITINSTCYIFLKKIIQLRLVAIAKRWYLAAVGRTFQSILSPFQCFLDGGCTTRKPSWRLVKSTDEMFWQSSMSGQMFTSFYNFPIFFRILHTPGAL